jgi:hypothetical protein
MKIQDIKIDYWEAGSDIVNYNIHILMKAFARGEGDIHPLHVFRRLEEIEEKFPTADLSKETFNKMIDFIEENTDWSEKEIIDAFHAGYYERKEKGIRRELLPKFQNSIPEIQEPLPDDYTFTPQELEDILLETFSQGMMFEKKKTKGEKRKAPASIIKEIINKL